MEIRQAKESDLPVLLEMFDEARAYMRANGNREQWQGGYPQKSLILQDIRQGNCYVCQETGEILGVFSYFEQPDPTYARIYEGSWKKDGPYGTIHRIAVRAHRKGVAGFCFAYCFARCGNLRADTHKDNIPMQKALEKNGFQPCGIIYLESGDPRIAYQKTE